MNLFTHSDLPPLRTYQESGVTDAVALLRAGRQPILVGPTGSGKTRAAVEAVHRMRGRCLWLAHRMELITQAARTLRDDGADVGIIMAGVPRVDAEVQVASVQTLVRRTPPPVDLIVVDECHHAAASTYGSILAQYPGVPLLGLTATPFRLDGRGLGELFSDIVVMATAADLVADGTLHAPRVYAGQSPDLRGLRITMGDYQLSLLSERCNTDTANADIVREWQRRAAGLPTVCFAIDIQHSEAIVAAFQAAGVPAEHIDGRTDRETRAAVLARLAAGETHVVSNCQILTEGWDLPALRCAIVARPTASLNLHLQMIGRIMRSCPGKQGAILLDHAGNSHRHGLVTRRLRYSLDGAARVGFEDPLGLRRCKRCGLYYDIAQNACPDCGWKPEPMDRDRPVSGPGELYEFDDSSPEYRRQFWNSIVADDPDRHPYWYCKRFEERFGVLPWDAIHSYGERQPGQPVVLAGEFEPTDKRWAYEQLYEAVKTLKKKDGSPYSPGWASWRYKQIYGVWPQGFVGTVRRVQVARRLTELLRR